MAWYQDAALAASSRRSYATGQNQFLRFCRLLGVPAVPVSEVTLIRFAAYLARSVGCKTIRVYLAGVRMLHIQAGFQDPLQSAVRLQLTMKGIRRVQGTSHIRPPRLPITISLMKCLKSALRLFSGQSRRDKLMVWAAFTTAFFGFLRVSEFTAFSETTFEKAQTLLASDVTFIDDLALLCLRRSKTDPFGQG